jgi:hypothetical protein
MARRSAVPRGTEIEAHAAKRQFWSVAPIASIGPYLDGLLVASYGPRWPSEPITGIVRCVTGVALRITITPRRRGPTRREFWQPRTIRARVAE